MPLPASARNLGEQRTQHETGARQARQGGPEPHEQHLSGISFAEMAGWSGGEDAYYFVLDDDDISVVDIALLVLTLVIICIARVVGCDGKSDKVICT